MHPLLKPRECPEAWQPDVPELETPPTQQTCRMELLIAAGICRDAESPSLFSMWNSPIPSRWIAHLGYLSRDVVGGPRCLHTGRREVLLIKARVCEWTSGKERRRRLMSNTCTQADRKPIRKEGKHKRKWISNGADKPPSKSSN